MTKPVWFDFTGDCPLCGKTLCFDPLELGAGPRRMTCGGYERHRWLLYFRRGALGKVYPTRLRRLKSKALPF